MAGAGPSSPFPPSRDALCDTAIAALADPALFAPVQASTVSGICGYRTTFFIPRRSLYASICPADALAESHYATGKNEHVVLESVSFSRHPSYELNAPRKKTSLSCRGAALPSPVQNAMKEKTTAFIAAQVQHFQHLQPSARYVRASELPAELDDVIRWFITATAATHLDSTPNWTTYRERVKHVGVEYAYDDAAQSYYLLIYRRFSDRGKNPPVYFRVEQRANPPVYERAWATVLWVHNYNEDTKAYWFAR